MHHIAFDGQSAEILWSELSELYAADLAGRPAGLAPVRVQYVDHVIARRADPARPSEVEFWRTQLRRSDHLGRSPLDRSRPADWDARGDLVMFSVPADVADRLVAVGGGWARPYS